jgi:Ca-activated chloride channel family protein
LQQAAELLSGREDAATLVLVSDGIETCDDDPCKVTAKLKEQGIKAVIHAVGFDVDKKAAAQLDCIAKAGGGHFFQADNIEQLRDALMQVKTAAVARQPLPEPLPPPPPPKTEPVVAATSTSKTLRIAGPGKVVLKPAAWVTMPPRGWALTDVESGEVKASGNTAELRVKAGEYQLRWRQSEHGHVDTQLTTVIDVPAGKTVEAPVDTGIRVTVPEGIGGPYWWGLVMDEGEKDKKEPFYRSREIGKGQVVPAGNYQLYWHQNEHGALPVLLGDVVIEEGKLLDMVLDSGLAVQPADWVGKKVYYYGLKDREGKLVASWNWYAPQLAPAGVYTLVIRPSEHRHSEINWGPVTITKDGFTKVAINSGLKFNHDPKARPPYQVFLVNLDNGEEIAVKETWDPIPAPPGRYRLDWWETQHGSKRQTIAEEFSIEPGTLIEVDM